MRLYSCLILQEEERLHNWPITIPIETKQADLINFTSNNILVQFQNMFSIHPIDYLFKSHAPEWNCSCDYRIKCYCREQMRLTQTNKSEIGVEKTNSIHNDHTPTNFRKSTQTRSYRNNRIPINIQANTVSKRNNII